MSAYIESDRHVLIILGAIHIRYGLNAEDAFNVDWRLGLGVNNSSGFD